MITFLRGVLKSLGVRGKKIFSGVLSTPNFRDGELDQTSSSCTRCLPKPVDEEDFRHDGDDIYL